MAELLGKSLDQIMATQRPARKTQRASKEVRSQRPARSSKPAPRRRDSRDRAPRGRTTLGGEQANFKITFKGSMVG